MENNHQVLTVVSVVVVLLLTFSILTGAGNQSAQIATSLPRETSAPALLVKFKTDASSQTKNTVLAQRGLTLKSEIPGLGVAVVSLPPQANPQAELNSFQRNPSVEFAELDQTLSRGPATTERHSPKVSLSLWPSALAAVVAVIPNDPQYPIDSWHLPKVGAPTAWGITTGATSTIIAILDSGLDETHPELVGRVVPGWNFYTNTADTHSTSTNLFGTQLAGVIGAASNNNAYIASLCWTCRLMPLVVTDSAGNTTVARVASALTWAAGHGARIANISFGAIHSSTLDLAAQDFQSRGGLVVMSSPLTISDSLPNDPYILTVNATEKADLIFGSAATSSGMDLAAPGYDLATILSGAGPESTVSINGKAFGTAVVSGAAGLVLSAKPSLSSAELENILKQTADDLGPAGWDASYGFGRLNVAKAVASAANKNLPTADTTPPTVTVTSPGAGSTVSGTIYPSASATDTGGSVARVDFYLDDVLKAADTTVPYSFSLNTTTFPNGSVHTLVVYAFDTAGNFSATGFGTHVSFTVDNSNPTPVMPVITNPAVTNITRTSATVGWTTNVPTTGLVKYSTSSRNLNLSATDSTATSTHALPLTGLQANKVYYYQIIATNPVGGLTAQTAILTFKTVK